MIFIAKKILMELIIICDFAIQKLKNLNIDN